MIRSRKISRSGFTLIELIVTLVIAAIGAAMLYTFFGPAFTQSSVPIARLRQVSNLQQVMENIVADYNRLNQINLRNKWRSGHSYKIGQVVLPTDSTGDIANNARYYVCTTAGTSGNTPPSWHTDTATITTLNRTVNDDEVTWLEKGYVWKAGTVYPNDSIIIPAENNGHYYKGGGATSGGDDPADNGWETDEGQTEDDGEITWTEAGTILKSDEGAIENLWTLLPAVNGTNARYGTGYTLTEKKFIQFDNSNQETDAGSNDEKNLLKVTIKNDSTAETLTQLFTIR
jgi:prepilin-type N-terminal cleavage/methylation domain-containing protein